MNSEELENITKNIKDKIGDDKNALIVDDIATLITKNNQIYQDLQNKDKEINDLKEEKNNLVNANSRLLQQIPMISDEEDKEKEKNEDKEKEPFSFRAMLDKKGRFI